jgi:hypothetical protein
MACPECGCIVTYQYDDSWDGFDSTEGWERCSACGYIFYAEDSAPDEEDYDDDYNHYPAWEKEGE